MAIICDRCGERIDSYRTHMFVSSETNINHIDPKSYYEDFDLCSECYKLFTAFIGGYDHVAYKMDDEPTIEPTNERGEP